MLYSFLLCSEVIQLYTHILFHLGFLSGGSGGVFVNLLLSYERSQYLQRNTDAHQLFSQILWLARKGRLSEVKGGTQRGPARMSSAPRPRTAYYLPSGPQLQQESFLVSLCLQP